ncbi:MAG: hypothetical protein AAFN17_05785, partial [Pseudomonadota bacterium]
MIGALALAGHGNDGMERGGTSGRSLADPTAGESMAGRDAGRPDRPAAEAMTETAPRDDFSAVEARERRRTTASEGPKESPPTEADKPAAKADGSTGSTAEPSSTPPVTKLSEPPDGPSEGPKGMFAEAKTGSMPIGKGSIATTTGP